MNNDQPTPSNGLLTVLILIVGAIFTVAEFKNKAYEREETNRARLIAQDRQREAIVRQTPRTIEEERHQLVYFWRHYGRTIPSEWSIKLYHELRLGTTPLELGLNKYETVRLLNARDTLTKKVQAAK